MDSRIAILRHFPALLGRWKGADAQLKELTQSHRTLRIFLQSPTRSGFLVIACIDPRHIDAPVSWSSAHIAITMDEEDGFVVTDVPAGVQIRTGGVEVKEFD